jgi:XTP/dITP diphosphohydrolase
LKALANMRVVLATSNPGKIRELEALLAPLGFDVRPLSDYTSTNAVESGLTFVENAILKARHAARASGLPAIADDSGIEVDALHGAPGVRSARYAGEGASDAENLKKLLDDLRGTPPERRGARYLCALAFLRWDADPWPLLAQASWEGRIIDAPRGSGGFGYDPIFEPAGTDRTAAELSSEEKNRVSHRAKALRLLVDGLRSAALTHGARESR